MKKVGKSKKIKKTKREDLITNLKNQTIRDLEEVQRHFKNISSLNKEPGNNLTEIIKLARENIKLAQINKQMVLKLEKQMKK